MTRVLIVAGSAALFCVVLGASYLVLQACTIQLPLNLPWLQVCVASETEAAEADLARLSVDNESLLREIRLAEQALGKLQCEADYSSDLPDLAASGSSAPQSDSIDTDAWQDQNVSVLEGCWELDSDLSVENLQTRAVTRFTQWNMCFDASGDGTERMAATNGVSCEGPVEGAFDAAGRLAIREPGDLTCSDNSFIYQRDLACSLNDNGLASCVVAQPELDRNSTVRLRRAATGGL